MLTFEQALPEDITPIFRLNQELIDAYEDLASIDYPRVLDWVHHNIQKNLSFFSRILSDGRLAGYYCLMPSDGKLELDSFFVFPEFQCRGIGTQVLQKCLKSCTPIFLYVFRRNTRAIRLYERLEFRIVKEVGTTRYIMEYYPEQEKRKRKLPNC